MGDNRMGPVSDNYFVSRGILRKEPTELYIPVKAPG